MPDTLNDTIEFRFVTRTATEDYRVFSDSGHMRHSDSREFAPIRSLAQISSEDAPCAALFEEGNKIYLAVSGIKCGKNDAFGRAIRFSFCWIFQSADDGNCKLAQKAFTRMTHCWPEAEKQVQMFLKEQPKNSESGTDITFDQKTFMEWLISGATSNVPFEICLEGDILLTGEAGWPTKSCILKWTPETDGSMCVRKV